MKIQAALMREPQAPLSIEDVTIEDPRDNEILVRIVATGICHTDIVVKEGMMPAPSPLVLGHEGSGVVEKIGKGVTKVQPGDHVVLTFNSCGQCPSCHDKDVAYCHNFMPLNFSGARTDGTTGLKQGSAQVGANFFGQSSFATMALCHEQNVVRVDKDIPLEPLGPLGCGIQTGAGAAMIALDIKAGKSFAVFGTGSVGLSAIMGARVKGATTIVAIDLSPERLEMARELGATHTIDATKGNVTEQLMELTGAGLDYALDTTGVASVIRNAVDALAPRGTCAILGVPAPDDDLVLNEFHFMSGGRKLIGVVEGSSNPDTFIPALIGLWQNGQFPFDKLITYYPFEQINEAIEATSNGSAIKPIVKMQ